MNDFIKNFNIEIYNGEQFVKSTEPVIAELPVEIYINDRKITTIACTGIHLEELAIGFLRSEGIIKTVSDIIKINISLEGCRASLYTKENKKPHSNEYISSSGAKVHMPRNSEKIIDSDICIPAKSALGLMDDLLNATRLHEMTHGTHCSALATVDGIIVAREDIGRHNTIDMLVGYSMLEGIKCSDKIIITTGRISSEIVNKVLEAGVPVIISHSMPTSRSIDLARRSGIILIGYVRKGKMMIFSNEKRVSS